MPAVVQVKKGGKPEKGRKLRGSNPAVQGRKPGRKQKTKKLSLKQYKTQQRKLYSGDKVDHQQRVDRQGGQVNLADFIDPDVATKELLCHGFTRKPCCPGCGHDSLQGPFERPGRQALGRHWRCDDPGCRYWVNVLSGAKWLDSVCRFRSLTPGRLWHAVCLYTSQKCPSRQSVASGLGPAGPKIAQLVMDALRKLESDAAIKSNSRLRLDGPIEVDATSVSTFRIGKNSHAFAPEIRGWVRRKKKRTPQYFLTHFRLAGMVQRGNKGKLVVKKLRFVLLPPGGRWCQKLAQ
ncbi:unnamed protein product [Effrenium voratum]|uniref:Uncharacterized protein n=1 Tax=Effrenium voratum TaxID=2562239 RepID=A0AA36NBM5_9DINO|nr:unnamed protein product [Effrenium voratum]